MLSDGDVDESSTIVLEDHQDKEQPKRHCGYDEEVGGHDLVRVISQEGPPRLRRRPPLPPHVFGNGRLTHRDAQLLELSMDARGAPERIDRGHLANQRANVGWHPRPTRAMSTLPRPEQAKAAPMPGEYRRRLNDVERRVPAMPSLRQPRPQYAINGREAKPWTAGTIRDCQLVPKCEDFQMKHRA
jgi:hypothetical protein